MRPDRVDYALPLFREEARKLSLLRDIPGVGAKIETGFIKIDSADLPSEENKASASEIKGQALRYGLDVIHNFI